MKAKPVYVLIQLVTILFICITISAGSTVAETWFVRMTGDDSQDCQSKDTACATLHEAMERALSDGNGVGDLVVVGAGRYVTPATGLRKEGIVIGQGQGGTASNPFVILADTDGARTSDAGVVEVVGGNSGFAISASFVHLDGFAIRNAVQEAGILVSGSNEGIVLQNLDISGSNGHGISLQQIQPAAPRRKDMTILNTVIHHNTGDTGNAYGLQIRSTDHSFIKGVTVFDHQQVRAGINVELASNNTFKDIIVHSIAGDAVLVEAANNNMFSNLLLYNNDKSGILFARGRGNNVTNATIYKNGQDGYKTSPSNVANQILINSIIALNGDSGIDDRCLCTTHAFNILWMNTQDFDPSDTRGPDPTEIIMDPLLLNPNGLDGILGGVNGEDDDFRYQQIAAGELQNSPAVNAGSASVVSLGLDDQTTRSDNVPDTGRVDLGYHYRIDEMSKLPAEASEDMGSEIQALCLRLQTFVDHVNGWIGEDILSAQIGQSWMATTRRFQDELACAIE